ncbi:MAG: FAD binding domain-containing protein [Kiritimatiellae bacterium]|nr:FAD binding domain-containing protein [Kiritimatiellia bacterium]MDD4735454.1 FAD binding domain-containing protein [Kiritimatiellia bacterium]
MKIVDFIIPEKLPDARAALLELGEKGIPAAGCTAFQFYADGPERTAVLLNRLDLAGIRSTPEAFVIGAGTPLTTLHRFEAEGWALNGVIAQIASHQIRNISTLGGNIARVFPWADLPVALLALDGKILIQGREPRTYTVDQYFKTQPATLFTPGDLLTSIEVTPLAPNTGFAHVKQRMKSESFSMATASARVTIKDGIATDCRAAIGACIPFPTRINAIEEALAGSDPSDRPALDQAVTATLKPLSFLSKEGMSKDYIRHLAATTLADAIQQAAQDAQRRLS